jgi:hypothetical protein
MDGLQNGLSAPLDGLPGGSLPNFLRSGCFTAMHKSNDLLPIRAGYHHL